MVLCGVPYDNGTVWSTVWQWFYVQYVTWREPSSSQRKPTRSQHRPQEEGKKWSSKVIFLTQSYEVRNKTEKSSSFIQRINTDGSMYRRKKGNWY